MTEKDFFRRHRDFPFAHKMGRKEVMGMLSAVYLLLQNSLVFTLRVSGAFSGSFPRPLSAEEERECLARTAKGDMVARNKLVEHNLRLVAHIVKKYYVQAEDQEDLISIGTIGLIKAIGSFSQEKGTRLATYAARCIENEILMYFRGQKKTQGEVSLSETIDTDKDGNSLMLMDIVGEDDTMLEDLQDRENRAKLRRLVETVLTKQERDIIVKRYGLDGDLPRIQRDIAVESGISRSYVSRIEKRALQKLQFALENER